MEEYQRNIKKYQDEAASLKKVLNRISFLRLIVFIISISILIALFSANLIIPVFFVLPLLILCFALVIKRYNKVEYQYKHTSFLKEINESEILKEKCQLESFDEGDKFIDQNHPYTSDLDIFGQHSVYQLINRTTTESGALLLSEWLRKPASKIKINERQIAVKELVPKINWRQDFQASGMHHQNKKSAYYKLLAWAEKPAVLLAHRGRYLACAVILPILFFVSVYFLMSHLFLIEKYIYLSLLLIVMAANYLILKKIKPFAEDIVETATENLKTFKGYSKLIHQIENETFESKSLVQLKSNLIKDNLSAYKEINKICSILNFSHQKPIKNIPIGGNYVYALLNSFLLFDIYLVLGVEKWKEKNSASLKSWTESVSEIEALNSFAGFYYANPSYSFPLISDKNNYVHFDLLGHPLIEPINRVSNDFRSEGRGSVVMITGSNMGGKSTFLRTVGVNLVLALAGAPCCAKYAELTDLKVFTSMRTQDNLMKGHSSFYAELNRIEKMLKLMEGNENIYFLLDEMFKGTNSEDRHKGGFSLIKQLSKLNTSGIIATHDIELAKLAGQKELVKNYSFNSEIKDGSMIFSYELYPDICYDFNASELMKRSGIKIL